MTEAQLLLLWGKTCREKNDEKEYFLRYHPLMFHLLDVGHCALALWETTLSERIKERIADALGCGVETAKWTVAFLAAVHDLGKASPNFQFQVENSEHDWLCSRLRASGFDGPKPSTKIPHNFISSKELVPIWRDHLWRWLAEDADGAIVLARITGAHHGTFPSAIDFSGMNVDAIGGTIWAEARLALMDWIATSLCPENFVFPPLKHFSASGLVPVLAGFISVADWIGSSDHFPPVAHRDKGFGLQGYTEASKLQAEEALADFGFTEHPQFPSSRRGFASFWGFEPNDLQKAVIAQVDNVSSPFLLLCEAPMGWGKTESAFWAIDAAITAKVNSGFYFALPTQATSNAIHERAADFLSNRLPRELIHLQLVHGNAGLLDSPNVVFKPLPQIHDQLENDPEKARVMALSWFTGAKRPLLAPFGVGTIDQGLMGALQTRHWFVRLFALAGKVVVVDECHAYSCYSTNLLKNLLHWLRELECSVILLSATLPSSQRAELVEAWGAALPEKEKLYPRLTWCEAEKVATSIEIDTKELTPKTIAIDPIRSADIASELRSKLKNGGCAAVICNTVDEIQDLFETLQVELADFLEPENLILYHARMPFLWRQGVEGKIKSYFGKKKTQRPWRAVVCASPVLQESLDVDFDIMMSALCPTDLLLQRVGRLHRHAHTPERYDLVQPQLLILSDAEGGGPPDFGKSEAIYEREILLRSWLIWRDRESVELPRELEGLIQQTYEEEVDAEMLNEAWWQALKDAHGLAEDNRKESEEKAKEVVVRVRTSKGNVIEPIELVEFPTRQLHDDGDPTVNRALRISTRDGDESVTVICLCEHEGKHYLPSPLGTPNLSEPVNLQLEVKGKHDAKRLMDFAVSISKTHVYRALIKASVPTGWRKSPFLRYARPVIFKNGVVDVNGLTLQLDGQLGIKYVKDKKKSEPS